MSTIDATFDLEGQRLTEWIEKVATPLSRCELESLTIEAILEHRRRTSAAEAAYEDCQAARKQLGRESAALKETFRELSRRNYKLIELVEALTTRLGYIPELPSASSSGGE